MNCRENTSLAALGKLVSFGFIRRGEERALAVTYGQRWTSHCSRTWRLLPWLW